MFPCDVEGPRGWKLWPSRWSCWEGIITDQGLACVPVAGVDGRKLVPVGGGWYCRAVRFGAYLSVSWS